MKRTLLIFCMIVYSLWGYSQLSVFDKYIQFNQKTDVYPITSNPIVGLPIVFMGGKNIDIIYLNNKHKVVNEAFVKRSNKDTKLYTGSYLREDSTLVLTFCDKNLLICTQISVKLTTGEYIEESTSFNIINHKYLTSWEKGDSLYILSIVNNSNIIVLSKFFGINQRSANEYNVDFDKITSDDHIKSLYELLNTDKGKLEKIINEMPVSLYLSAAKNKAYLAGNEIILSFDYFAGVTFLLKFNLLDDNYELEKYPIGDSIEEKVTNTNSFFYNDVLFQLSISDMEIGLYLNDLKLPNKVKKYYAQKNQRIDFTNSPIIKRNEKQGFLYGTPTIKKIYKTKKFLRLAADMNSSISVFKNKSDLQIIMGAVDNIQQSGGVRANTLIVSGGNMVSGMGNNLIAPESLYHFPTNYSFSSYSSLISISFSSVVNSQSFKYINRPITKYTYNFITDYANLMPGHQGLVTIFKFKGDYYLGYYTYGSSTYSIEWFKNVDDYSIQY